MRLRTTATALLTAILLSLSAAAEPKWIRINSEHFEMNSTAGEANARDTLRYFEQVRSFFLEAFGDLNKKPLPVLIVLFNSDKEYKPYSPNEVAAAYFQAGAERDYIVLSHAGSENYPTAVHEYVHLLARHAEFNFPVWLNEGIADLYSTLRPQGGNIIVGTPPVGRIETMLQSKWVPLSIILTVDVNSPYYNEKNKAGSLYSEGWALTHMLMLGTAYRPAFGKFLHALGENKDSEAALLTAYGKPLDKIDKDLQAYIRQSTVNGVVFPTKLQKDVGELAVSVLPPFEVKLRLAELLERPNDLKPARQAMEELIAMQPQRPEPYVLLGYLEWHGRQSVAARKNFQRAFELGSHNPRMLWDYGRLLGSDAQAIAVYSRLLEDDPARVDVRIELAAAQVRDRQAPAAVLTLKPITKVTPADATRLFRVRMLANYEANELDTARMSAESLIKYSKDASEIAEAQRLIEYIDEKKGQPARAVTASPVAEDRVASNVGPTLRRGTPRATESRPATVVPPPMPSVTGSFVELRCVGDKATVILNVGDGAIKRFLIDKPDNIILQRPQNGTSPTGSMDMTCGQQKPSRVKVGYAVAPPGSGVDGLVRMMEWSPEEQPQED
jgi:tetratricopeptide (TPR) repeat protein